ncbi:Undecaprenyl-phosphate N-acetylglucosaminyl 1-phosphate transferase [hydrothermal vent metagenome]|uniref:Undecaprenyl-phosphate N-acetylglucosaminyl 1-phosphate transferase n=1 Tax=hydrothermal vent metagenome TaxID=652676 RepID=A0A1W1CCL1_9ZZZZ
MMGVLISIVSYLDDLYELSASIRLGVQSLVATLGLYFIGGLQTLDLFFFTISNPFAVNTFAFFMIVWFINLYNFLDGIDGYAGSETIFIGIAGFLLFGGDHFLILIVAVLGFLVWNWHRAKIFMGDVGSTLLGYNIAIFTIYYANQEANNLWVWIIIFGLFWFDATLTLYRRYKNGEQLSKAHKKHAYQRLTQSGWSHSKVTIYSIFINAILFIIAWVMRDNSSLTFIYFTMSIVFLYTIVRFIDSRKGFI